MNEITNDILHEDGTLMDVFKLSNSESQKFEIFANNKQFVISILILKLRRTVFYYQYVSIYFFFEWTNISFYKMLVCNVHIKV